MQRHNPFGYCNLGRVVEMVNDDESGELAGLYAFQAVVEAKSDRADPSAPIEGYELDAHLDYLREYGGKFDRSIALTHAMKFSDEAFQVSFLESGSERETSTELLEAILAVAGSGAEALRVWTEPSQAESIAVWERVTKNGLMHSTEFCWGAAGSKWATALGLDN